MARELKREVVKYVGRIPAPGQQNDWPARAAPVEHFQSNILINAYKSRRVRGCVLPAHCALRVKKVYQQNEHSGTH